MLLISSWCGPNRRMTLQRALIADPAFDSVLLRSTGLDAENAQDFYGYRLASNVSINSTAEIISSKLNGGSGS
jgi:hypothetical protein